ncbi:MurR/RpiR family transcriptional regulator [Roseovarius sp. 2305UL8-3]|uniref:MurR/RpiR family transcriptional regulator n=1 Tax=Roseovarius conchicola TaxID=3121636 RepID=UPI0035298FCC
MPRPKPVDLTPGKIQSLSPQLRKAARYVVENPGEIATRSQRFVAKSTNLPAPTFTRLARAIGYETYDDLRDVCRQDLLHKRTFLADKAQAQLRDSTDETSFAAHHVSASLRNIDAMLTDLDEAQLEAAASVLAKARRVSLIGLLSAKPIVDYAAYLANMSLGNWRSLGLESGALANDLADLDHRDACLVFSVQPYAARAVELARHVAAQNVPVIVLTDSPLAPAAEYADHCFCLKTDSPQFFPSHATALVFFETIIGMIIQRNGATAQERIAKIERHNHELGEYWQDEPASNTQGKR